MGSRAGAALPTPQPRLALCPYCGEELGAVAQCGTCRGLMDPLSKQASQNAMGPWAVRDEGAPFRPCFSYETLRGLIARGRVNAQSVLRGPSTRQFWMRASQVPGVAHLLGMCHACQHAASATDKACSACGATFEVETDRQFLGLSPIRLLPGHASAEQIAAAAMQTPRAEQPRGARSAAAAAVPVIHQVVASGPTPGALARREAGPMTPNLGEPSALVAAMLPREFDQQFAVPRQKHRGWQVTAILSILICLALIATFVVMVFLYPDVITQIQSLTYPNK